MKTGLSFIFLLYMSIIYAHTQQEKDTLYFHLDDNYLKFYPDSPLSLYPIDTQGEEESFFLVKKDTIQNLFKPSYIGSLKDFLNERIYSSNKRVHYSDLVRELKKFEIFLVKNRFGCSYYIKVVPSYEVY